MGWRGCGAPRARDRASRASAGAQRRGRVRGLPRDGAMAPAGAAVPRPWSSKTGSRRAAPRPCHRTARRDERCARASVRSPSSRLWCVCAPRGSAARRYPAGPWYPCRRRVSRERGWRSRRRHFLGLAAAENHQRQRQWRRFGAMPLPLPKAAAHLHSERRRGGPSFSCVFNLLLLLAQLCVMLLSSQVARGKSELCKSPEQVVEHRVRADGQRDGAKRVGRPRPQRHAGDVALVRRQREGNAGLRRRRFEHVHGFLKRGGRQVDRRRHVELPPNMISGSGRGRRRRRPESLMAPPVPLPLPAAAAVAAIAGTATAAAARRRGLSYGRELENEEQVLPGAWRCGRPAARPRRPHAHRPSPPRPHTTLAPAGPRRAPRSPPAAAPTSPGAKGASAAGARPRGARRNFCCTGCPPHPPTRPTPCTCASSPRRLRLTRRHIFAQAAFCLLRPAQEGIFASKLRQTCRRRTLPISRCDPAARRRRARLLLAHRAAVGALVAPPTGDAPPSSPPFGPPPRNNVPPRRPRPLRWTTTRRRRKRARIAPSYRRPARAPATWRSARPRRRRRPCDLPARSPARARSPPSRC